MQVAVVNRRAARKHAQFVASLETVWVVIEETQKLLNRIPAGATSARSESWRFASREQLEALRKAALANVEALQVRSRTYEAELVSREWRV